MDIHPVTTADFTAQMHSLKAIVPQARWLTQQKTPRWWSFGSCTIGSSKARFPVNCVNWHAARAYCQRLGKRLPTELEWEYAARANTRTAFWWGNTPDTSHCPNVYGSTVVTQGPRCNPWSICDVLGGDQWTASLFRKVSFAEHAEHDGRNAPRASGRRVTRGIWCGMGNLLKYQLWRRAPQDPTLATGGTWFRCAKSLTF